MSHTLELISIAQDLHRHNTDQAVIKHCAERIEKVVSAMMMEPTAPPAEPQVPAAQEPAKESEVPAKKQKAAPTQTA